MKKVYESPRAEMLALRLEANVMSNDKVYGSRGAAGGDIEEGNTYDL